MRVGRRALRFQVLVGLALSLTACGGSPLPDFPKTPSTAFDDYRSTRLGQNLGAPNAESPELSGFRLLPEAREGFIARLALADVAERSLDMQYYIWDGDTTGRLIVDRVIQAADRGVKVRLLVDDPYYHHNDPVIASIDAHPNIEIRLFNPVLDRGWYQLDFITDFDRLDRRMHNKLMVTDNAGAIVGGRNIGDVYYGVNTTANFRDLDVFAVGPVVRDLSEVFDRFWNSASAVPITALVEGTYGPDDLDAFTKEIDEWRAEVEYPYPIDQDLAYLERTSAELRAKLTWAEGRIVADHPEAVAASENTTDVASFLVARVDELDEELLIETAYLVLRDMAIDILVELVERGVEVKILTNSLASNDVLPVHAGYAKTRSRLLDGGVQLYELQPDTDAFRSGWSSIADSSRSALHAKAFVFDREAVFVGSYNLDPRSADINTEAGLYIESPELAAELATLIETEMAPENSYRLTMDRDRNLVWQGVVDDELVRFDDEPNTTFSRRFVVDLLKLLPLESQL